MSSCRQRKLQCSHGCGYVMRGTMAWMRVGLPTCPCGGTLEPTDPADLAELGLLTADDFGKGRQSEWTVLCREQGWSDDIVRTAPSRLKRRKGESEAAYEARMAARAAVMVSGLMGRATKGSNAEHCAFAGCGLWVAAGADWCSAGHPQVEGLEPVPAEIPF